MIQLNYKIFSFFLEKKNSLYFLNVNLFCIIFSLSNIKYSKNKSTNTSTYRRWEPIIGYFYKILYKESKKLRQKSYNKHLIYIFKSNL